MSQTQSMGDPDWSSKVARIALLIDRAGGKTALSRLSGIDRKTIGTYANGGRAWKESTLRPLAEAVSVDLNWLLTGIGDPDGSPTRFFDLVPNREDETAIDRGDAMAFSRSLRMVTRGPLLRDAPAGLGGVVAVAGYAAGSVLDSRRKPDLPAREVRCPPALEGTPGVYARIIQGESMADRWPAGDVIFACSNRKPASGELAIIEVQGANGGAPEVLFKIFIGNEKDKLVVSQFNRSAGGALTDIPLSMVLHVHRVYTRNELFGL